jgi:hypothetical protein
VAFFLKNQLQVHLQRVEKDPGHIADTQADLLDLFALAVLKHQVGDVEGHGIFMHGGSYPWGIWDVKGTHTTYFTVMPHTSKCEAGLCGEQGLMLLMTVLQNYLVVFAFLRVFAVK